jgi:aryl-alcohol dehydrogenase-like predicted oxidoreductase
VYLENFTSFQSVFDKYPNYSPAQLSLRFCISHPACHVVIPGGKTREQVQENAVASDLDFIPYESFQI